MHFLLYICVSLQVTAFCHLTTCMWFNNNNLALQLPSSTILASETAEIIQPISSTVSAKSDLINPQESDWFKVT